MRRTALCLCLLFGLGLCFGHFPQFARGAAEPAPQVVYLKPSTNWLLLRTNMLAARPLARELMRQAFLLAARDELGLTTRDAWLGDAIPADAKAWIVAAPLQRPPAVEIFRTEGAQETPSVRVTLPGSVCQQFSVQYFRFAELAEQLSRTQFVEALKKAGYQGQPTRRDESIAVPPEIETQLQKMNFLTQYQAVRALHKIMRTQGESTAVLGALSRGYAHLGLLTEYYWHPAHKVFKARALLYAQRILARDKKSPRALWQRAYAAALVGDYKCADMDLRLAERAAALVPEKDRPAQPAWVKLIKAYIHYDIPALEKCAQEEALAERSALLRLLAVDHAGGQAWVLQTAVAVADQLPECYYLYEKECQFGGVSMSHSATVDPIEKLRETLYRRLSAIPDLPPAVQKLIVAQNTRNSIWGALLGSQEDDADEFKQRAAVIKALLASGAPPTAQTTPATAETNKDAAPAKKEAAADAGEPSWATLGLLLRELSFVQVFRRAKFERNAWGVPTEDWLAETRPLVADHPYCDYLDTFVADDNKRHEAAVRLARVSTAGADFNCYNMCLALEKTAAVRGQFFRDVIANEDHLVQDVVKMARVYQNDKNSTTAWLGKTLLGVSADSPFGRSLLLKSDFDKVRDKLDEWDKISAPYPSLSWDLALRYVELGRWQDAERCYLAAIKVMPSEVVLYQQLADQYLKQNREDRWLATLTGYLDQPDFGLGHSRVRAQIARHYMDEKKWRTALPYAEAAAESYSAWGLLISAQCHEALQNWPAAEQFYRACSERYPDSVFAWYFFCRRTGHGDRVAAHVLAADAIAQLDKIKKSLQPFDIVLYYLLENQPQKAAPLVEKSLGDDVPCADAASRFDNAIWLALIGDETKDPQARDAALNRARAFATQDARRDDPAVKSKLAMINMLIDDLAHGGKGNLDSQAIDALFVGLTPVERFATQWTLAQYLHLHGRDAAAKPLWLQCMGHSYIEARYRTCAGVQLGVLGVKAADYKTLLNPQDIPPERPATDKKAAGPQTEKADVAKAKGKTSGDKATATP